MSGGEAEQSVHPPNAECRMPNAQLGRDVPSDGKQDRKVSTPIVKLNIEVQQRRAEKKTIIRQQPNGKPTYFDSTIFLLFERGGLGYQRRNDV